MHKIYFLHGFAGDTADWDAVIKELPEYECRSLEYPFVIPNEGTLVGYSMGGRIALESPLPKIIISANPTSEGQNRSYWIEKLESVPLKTFFKEWYNQPLFDSLRRHSSFPAVMKRRLQADRSLLIEQLKNHPLKELERKASFVHGQLDLKYKALYERLQLNSYEIKKAGHACHLENPIDVARVIRSILTNFQ